MISLPGSSSSTYQSWPSLFDVSGVSAFATVILPPLSATTRCPQHAELG